MATRRKPETGFVDIGTTTLYHEVRGHGPTLMLISGGGDDAGQWTRVASTLEQDFTVLTYDRRGLSRSPRPDGWVTTSVDEQADDAAALLRALDLAPAIAVGHSAGASVACSLVARHPGVVRHAVIYEPPLFAILSNREEVVGGFQAMVERAMAEGGPRHAMSEFIRANAGDEAYESWHAAADPAYLDRLFGNAETFFSIELPAFAAFVPDRDAMRASGVPLTVVVGKDNRDGWYGDAVNWLVEGAGAGLIELPGGHGGFITYQDQFVSLVQCIGRDATVGSVPPKV